MDTAVSLKYEETSIFQEFLPQRNSGKVRIFNPFTKERIIQYYLSKTCTTLDSEEDHNILRQLHKEVLSIFNERSDYDLTWKKNKTYLGKSFMMQQKFTYNSNEISLAEQTKKKTMKYRQQNRTPYKNLTVKQHAGN